MSHVRSAFSTHKSMVGAASAGSGRRVEYHARVIRLRQSLVAGLRHPILGPALLLCLAFVLVFVVLHSIEHGVEGLLLSCVMVAVTFVWFATRLVLFGLLSRAVRALALRGPPPWIRRAPALRSPPAVSAPPLRL